MSIFPAIGISASGIAAAQTWINTSAGNLANMNDTVPVAQKVYQQETPIFSAVGVPGSTGQGVAVTSIALGSAAGLVVSDPGSPQANAQGDVREANISTSQQLVNLVQAQNDYQANASAYDRAVVAYQAALTLGQ